MIEVEDRTQPEPEERVDLHAPTSLDDALAMLQPAIDRAKDLVETLHAEGLADDFMPVAFFFSEARGVDLMGVHCGSSAEKALAAYAIRTTAAGLALARAGLWAVMFIGDVIEQTLNVPAAACSLGVSVDELEQMLRTMPEMREVLATKRECLLVRIETYFGDRTLSLYYKREPGKITWLAPELDTGPVGGRFTDLLPPKGPAEGDA